MLKKLRAVAKENILLRKLVGYHLASSGLFDNYIKKYPLSESWQKRLDSVMASEDNKFIKRDEKSGLIHRGKQIMHNGLKIHLGSYYGPEYAKMLELNKGVHEPQEERVFSEVLPTIQSGSTMIEMGAFWSFYSMWFQQAIKNANNYMIESDAFNLGHGKRNFRLNKMKGIFQHAFIGKSSINSRPVSTICIDDFVEQNNISFVDMLHSDIQGYEYDMLLGAEGTFQKKKVGYVFISTHSNEIHYKCLDFLNNRNFIIIASADIDQTYSEDGLIAARATYYPGIEPILISLNRRGVN